eukprot:SAG31_NODE_33798_length_340_cov_0.630705_1_plen_71_part_10
MTADQRAAQCHQAMQANGWTCPANQVNLVCFNAGGFPKQKCSTYCTREKQGSYVPAGTLIPVYSYYPRLQG